MSLLLAILAQVGPFPQPATQPASPLPPEILERKRQEQAAVPPPTPAPAVQPARSAELEDCLALVRNDPPAAAELAEEWLDTAEGTERADAGQCLGMALARLERWIAAESAFREARSAADPANREQRARLAAMAGNAALARGEAESALEAFDAARLDAKEANDNRVSASIALDRSRALVALGRDEEARDSLAEARNADPANSQAWLLSATLSRRMGELAMAQVQIQEAARLMSVDPEIGLEAGVIAMLAGNETAARKSWQSVIEAAPQSDAAGTARDYLAQLGEEEAISR